MTEENMKGVLDLLDLDQLPGWDTEPASWKDIHRQIRETVSMIRADSSEFIASWIEVADTSFVDWEKVVKVLCKHMNTRHDQVKTMDDVGNLLTSPASSLKDKELYHFKSMVTIYNRHVEFMEFRDTIYSRFLATIRNKLQKYCISFKAESDDLQMAAVAEYQRQIDQFEYDIGSLVLTLEEKKRKYGEYFENLKMYYREYFEVINIMKRTTGLVDEIAEKVLEWVAVDAEYPDAILEDIQNNNRMVNSTREEIFALDADMKDFYPKLHAKQSDITALKREKAKMKDELAVYQQRLSGLISSYSKYKGDQKETEMQLQAAKLKRDNTLWIYKPAQYKELGGIINSMHRELEDQDQRILKLKKQIDNLRPTESEILREIRLHDDDISADCDTYDALIDRKNAFESNIRGLQRKMRRYEKMNSLLKKIHALKKATFTYKKIYQNGYKPGVLLDKEDELDHAFRIVVNCIGDHWQLLYQTLPFLPRRDAREREKDLDEFERTSMRAESSGQRTACQKSLDKWRRRHTNPTLPDLIDSLRKLQLTAVMKRIEMDVLGIDPFANTQSMYKTLGALGKYTPVELQGKFVPRNGPVKLPALTGSHVKHGRAKVNQSFDSAIDTVSSYNQSFHSQRNNSKRGHGGNSGSRSRRGSGEHFRISVTPANQTKRRKNKFDTVDTNGTHTRQRLSSRESIASSTSSIDSARSARHERSFLDTGNKRVRRSMEDHVSRYRKSRSKSPSPSDSLNLSARSNSRLNKSMSELTEKLRSKSLLGVLRTPSNISKNGSSSKQNGKANGSTRGSNSRNQNDLNRSGSRTRYNSNKQSAERLRSDSKTRYRSLDSSRRSTGSGRKNESFTVTRRSTDHVRADSKSRFRTPNDSYRSVDRSFRGKSPVVPPIGSNQRGRRSNFSTEPPKARSRGANGKASVTSRSDTFGGNRGRSKLQALGFESSLGPGMGGPTNQLTTRGRRVPAATRINHY